MKEIPIYRHVGGRKWGPSARFAVVGYAKVDDYWFDRLTAMGMWLECRSDAGVRYARLQGTGGANGCEVAVMIHQVVGGRGWDHKDGDGLNNQESNLRPATRSQQMSNQRLHRNSISGEPGVSWRKATKKWNVRVKKDKKVVFQKYFKDFDEAVRVQAREQRKKFHGLFVR